MAEKSERLVIAVLASAMWMNDARRGIEELPFSCIPHLNKGWSTAKTGSKHVVDRKANLRSAHVGCICQAKGQS